MLNAKGKTKNALNVKTIGLNAYSKLKTLEEPVNIEGAFDDSFYIKVAENELLRFIKYEEYVSASSVVINLDNRDRSFKSMDIRKGMDVRVIDDDLLIGNGIKISDIKNSTIWYPPEAPDSESVSEIEVVKLNLRVMRDVIYTSPSREGLVPLLENIELLGSIELFLKPQEDSLVERARPGIERTMWSLFAYDLETIIKSVNTLVGLGPGLTPSCDDFLAGLILGLSVGEEVLELGGLEDKRFYSEIAERIYKEAQGKTTVFSLSMLREACEGVCPQVVINLIYSLLTSGPDKVADDSKILIKMGDTSGADIAIGLFYGIRYLISKLENLEVLDGTA